MLHNINNIDDKVLERFWTKVLVNDIDACWIWQASCTIDGYGTFWFNPKTIRAHRFSWILVNGDIPDDMSVLHTCDNPPCVNPNHLFLGTNQDNINDKIAKSRHRIGENNSNAVLTDDKVRQIKQLYKTGKYSQRALADLFGVSVTQVCHIMQRKKWKHISD